MFKNYVGLETSPIVVSTVKTNIPVTLFLITSQLPPKFTPKDLNGYFSVHLPAVFAASCFENTPTDTSKN